LVKGGDWPTEKIAGSEFVQSYGGRVISIPLIEGHSTTNIEKRIKS
jgi:bifunctional ADP-heptose synthase (sugar kinase/adenylyltransferase)